MDEIIARLKEKYPDAKGLFDGLDVRCELGEVLMQWRYGIGRCWNDEDVAGPDGEQVVLDELRRFVIQSHRMTGEIGRSLEVTESTLHSASIGGTIEAIRAGQGHGKPFYLMRRNY